MTNHKATNSNQYDLVKINKIFAFVLSNIYNVINLTNKKQEKIYEKNNSIYICYVYLYTGNRLGTN